MKSKSLSYGGGQPWLARSCRILQRDQSGSSQALFTELRTAGDMSMPCDHDFDDSETDTAIPYDGDSVSQASHAQESVLPSSL